MFLRLMLISSLFSLNFTSAYTAEVVVDKINAVVNDNIVTMSDLAKFKKTFETRKARLSAKEYEETASDNKKLLNTYIDELLIEQYVNDKKMTPEESEIDEQIKSIAKRFNMTQEQFAVQLKKENIDMEQFRAEKKKDIIFARFFELELKTRITVSDNDVAEAFTKKTGEPVNETEYNIQLGVFNDPAVAMDSYKKALTGTFDESELGFLPITSMAKELKDEVTAMQKGDIKGPIKTPKGYYVIKLKDVRYTENSNFTNKKQDIKYELIEAESKKQAKVWCANRRDESYVKINS